MEIEELEKRVNNDKFLIQRLQVYLEMFKKDMEDPQEAIQKLENRIKQIKSDIINLMKEYHGQT